MQEHLRADPGSLLAAWPDLRDPNFMHRVVVLCQHTDAGAYGFVVNQETRFTTRELLRDHPELGDLDYPVHLGGPVGHDSLQFLHRAPDEIPGGVPLDAHLWYGGELDALGRFVRAEPEVARQKVRLFLGYSGWGAGQLDGELALGSWLVAPGTPEFVFGEVGEPTWRRVVRSAGHGEHGLENQPPDVSWN